MVRELSHLTVIQKMTSLFWNQQQVSRICCKFIAPVKLSTFDFDVLIKQRTYFNY